MENLILKLFQMNNEMRKIFIIIFLISWIYNTQALIGYDCGSPSANLTTLSLLNIEECDIPQQNVNSTKTYIQLLQINEFRSVRVIQCKVEVDRTVRKCGMFSHTMDVFNGKYSYIHEVTREACQRMHMYGSFQLAGTLIIGLQSNQSATRPVVLAGHIDNVGSCKGAAYNDPYGNWADVVVLASIKITLQDYIADVRINTNRVQLRSGVACELSSTSCTDIEGGDTFWDPVPADTCQLTNYGVLYEGYAEKIMGSINEQAQTVYSLTAQDTIFALTSRGKYTTCGYSLTRTEHPKLIIFETSLGTQIFKKQTQVANLDIFTYMNSKFVYVEKHIRTQINQLYRDILMQQCQLEQQMLQNSLAIATQSPDIFAYHLMKGPGYMALLAGEVIHIIKCVPVNVKIAQTTECYNHLPVIRGNETYYLTPQTHILLRQGTQVACNSFAPTMYLLGDAWYKFMPKPVDSIPPTTIKPMTRPNWRYVSPGSLATSGIYTESDLDELRDHIMFPAERPSLLNTVARGIMGRPTAMHEGSFSNLLDEASIEKLAESTWKKIWSKFLIFGNISAGVVGIYLIVRITKLLLDTIVHGYALHTVYGWSIYLLGAIWDSLTQLLLHLKMKEPTKKKEHKTDTDTLLETINSPKRTDYEKKETHSVHISPIVPHETESSYTLELKD